MAQSPQDTIATLITHYGLELDGSQVDTIILAWLDLYDLTWIVKAIVSSVYEGRYKVKSVDNMLKNWQRTGQIRHRVPAEYERSILQKLAEIEHTAEANSTTAQGRSLPHSGGSANEAGTGDRMSRARIYQPVIRENLNPEESAPFHHLMASNSARFPGELRLASEIEDLTIPVENRNLSTLGTADISSVADRDQPPPAQTSRQNWPTEDRSISLPRTSQLINTLTIIIEQNQQPECSSSDDSPIPFPQHLQ